MAPDFSQRMPNKKADKEFSPLSAYQINDPLELKAVLKSSCLIKYEVLMCAVVVLEELTYALKLNCDA